MGRDTKNTWLGGFTSAYQQLKSGMQILQGFFKKKKPLESFFCQDCENIGLGREMGGRGKMLADHGSYIA